MIGMGFSLAVPYPSRVTSASRIITSPLSIQEGGRVIGDSVPVGQFSRKNRSYRSFIRVSGTTSFSGESCNAQFSAPRSQMIVLMVNITL